MWQEGEEKRISRKRKRKAIGLEQWKNEDSKKKCGRR